MIRRLLPALIAAALFAFAPLAIAQPGPDDGGSASGMVDASAGDETDRPMRRALAYERRDVVRELLERPGSLSAASAKTLAADVSIPPRHAEILVEGARSGQPVGNMPELLRLGLPNGATLPAGVSPGTATEAQLRSAGLTQAQAKEFISFRESARRVNLHFRELRAINEARARNTRAVEAGVREVANMSRAERLKAAARMVGLTMPDAEVSRAKNRARAAANMQPKVDGLSQYRRADGTLNVKEFARKEGLGTANGVAHFAFALFLKELAVTLRTGDERRLEQFVDGLMSTDFFVNYGLFAAGARAADVAYGRYVRRLTRKNFLNGVLRSNVVLAAGLAVPMVANGEFELDTYVVDVVALGLSATAVKAAVEGMSGVYRMARGGKAAINLGRFASPAGWVWTAGETAIVLLAGDYIADKMDRWLDERKIRQQLEDAQTGVEDLMARLNGGEKPSQLEILRTLAELEEAYDNARRNKLMPVEGRLAQFHEILAEAGRKATIEETGIDRLARAINPDSPLGRHYANRYGSVDAFVERLRAAYEGELEGTLTKESEDLATDFKALVERAYLGERETAEEPPTEDSRMGLYDEETAFLLDALESVSDTETRDLFAAAIERVRRARGIDTGVLNAATGAHEEALTETMLDDEDGWDTWGPEDNSGAINALERGN